MKEECQTIAKEVVVLGASTPAFVYLYKQTGLAVRVSGGNFGFLMGMVVLRMTLPAVSIPILREKRGKSRRRRS